MLRGRTEAPAYQVWLMRSDGSHARQVTHLKVSPLVDGLVPVAFSATSNRLLAGFVGQGTSQTRTIQLPSGRARQLTVELEPLGARPSPALSDRSTGCAPAPAPPPH